MPNSFPPELLTTFRAMAEVVYSGESYESVYEALCHSAVEFVDGCDHASLMLRQNGRDMTVAASDDIARRIDQMERQLDEGPCLDAMDDDEPDQHMCPGPDHRKQVAQAGGPRSSRRPRSGAWRASGSARRGRRSAP